MKIMEHDAIALGEILVDMIPFEVGDYTKVTGFSKNFGGAPFNYAIALSRLGRKVGAICSVGNDPFGKFLLETLRKEGVDTRHVKVKQARTTLAFVVRYLGGEREFFFYRKPWVETADSLIYPEDIDPGYISSARILHVSGVILSHEPARSSVLKALEIAKGHDVYVSFDINYRLDIWDSKEELLGVYDKALRLSDIILISRDEARELLKTENPSTIADILLKKYRPKIVAVKLGAKGAYVKQSDGAEVFKEAFKVNAVDTTGAGDAWAAGFELGMLEERDLEECVVIANAVGALSVTKIGAINALPTREQLRVFLKKRDVSINL